MSDVCDRPGQFSVDKWKRQQEDVEREHEDQVEQVESARVHPAEVLVLQCRLHFNNLFLRTKRNFPKTFRMR